MSFLKKLGGVTGWKPIKIWGDGELFHFGGRGVGSEEFQIGGEGGQLVGI